MDSFWQSALEAAEKAKAVAKSVSQKGIEFAEATAEEAGKKFKDLNLSSTITSSTSPKPTAPSETELISYGITPQFIEFIRSLNYNTFRDFSAGTAASPTDAPASGIDAPDAPTPLNAWQVRHAMLVVRAVKEVNELRYVLCPRYMPDQKFWQVYFALTGSHLPAIASTYKEGDPLPPVSGAKEEDEDTFMSLTGIQGHLKTIGTKIQAAATAATKGKVGGSGGVELSSLLPLSVAGGTGSSRTTADGTGTLESTGPGGESTNSAHEVRGGALLEADPDLEAYLQTADDERQENYSTQNRTEIDDTQRNLEDGDVDEDDLDLDQYLNELSAEVGGENEEIEAENGGDDDDDDDGIDVEAVLKELQDEV